MFFDDAQATQKVGRRFFGKLKMVFVNSPDAFVDGMRSEIFLNIQ
jgi:hypothetical protein